MMYCENRMKLGMLMFLALGMLLFFSCRNDDDEIIPSVITKVTPSDSVPGPVKGFFLLNVISTSPKIYAMPP